MKNLAIDLDVKTSGTFHKIKVKNIINPFAVGDITGFFFESMLPDINTVIEFFDDSPSSITVRIDAG